MMMGMILGSSIILVGCQPELEVDSEDAVISDDQVPQIVQNIFVQKYPGRTPQWESQPYGYEAVFSDNGIEYEVELSADGQWLETEYEVSRDEQFPAIVLNQVRSRYPGYQITKREIEITPRGVFYEVEVENGNEEIELYFDGQGNLAENYHEDA